MSEARENLKLLVTGASGFLGSEIVAQCVAQGIQVISLGNSATPAVELPNYHAIDLVGGEIPDSLFDDVDVVIHSAGLAHQFGKASQDRKRFFDVNETAAERMAIAAAKNGVEHFVLISSSGVYGSGHSAPPNEQSECHPAGHYAESKFAGEKAVNSVAASQDLSVTILRMTTLYGEGDRGNVNRLASAIGRGKFVQIGSCQNRKNLIHKSDAARACLEVANNAAPTDSEIYNVGVPAVAMKEVVDAIKSATGKSPITVPGSLATLISGTASAVCLGKGPFARLHDSIKKWMRDDLFDVAKFQAAFSFTPKVTLQQGIGRQVQSMPAPQKKNSLLKRIFDLGLCLFLLLMLFIPMLIIAALVRLTSKGPALYWSERVGVNQKLFSMPKFRSMRTDTPEVATHLLSDSQSWITPLGKVLRKTSLDELPQLFNILLGHMSFVGPRPALHNQDDLNARREFLGLHGVRPGITGLAQVRGRDDLLNCEKVEFDRRYVETQSFGLDLKLIFETALAVLLKKGVSQAGEESEFSLVETREPTASGPTLIATPDVFAAVSKMSDLRSGLICVRPDSKLDEKKFQQLLANRSEVQLYYRAGEFEQASFSMNHIKELTDSHQNFQIIEVPLLPEDFQPLTPKWQADLALIANASPSNHAAQPQNPALSS